MPPKNLKFHSLPGKIMYGKKKKKICFRDVWAIKNEDKMYYAFYFPNPQGLSVSEKAGNWFPTMCQESN